MNRPALGALLALLSACPPPSRPDGGRPDGGFTVGNTLLDSLSLSVGALEPTFSPTRTLFVTQVPPGVSSVTVTAVPQDDHATLTIRGHAVGAGRPSAPIEVTGAATSIPVTVTNGDAVTDYLLVALAPQRLAFAADGGHFGTSIALAGDLLAIGAPGENRVYVYARTDGGWNAEGALVPPAEDPGDDFGTSVSLSGQSVAVGAPGDDSAGRFPYVLQADDSAPEAGAAWVFTRSNGTWAYEAFLKASNSDPDDRFGTSVSLDDDVLAVGAPGEDSAARGFDPTQDDNAAADAGAVYVFRRAGGTWHQEAYVKASNTRAGDGFGTSVSTSAARLLVGAPRESSNATGLGGNQFLSGAPGSGSAYVFVEQSGIWAQEAYVKPSDTSAGAHFASSVCLLNNTAAIGAPGGGAAYVFSRTDDTWSQSARFSPPRVMPGDGFGAGVALGGGMLAVGSPFENGSGAVTLFRQLPYSWNEVAHFTGAPAGAQFGTAVALGVSLDTLVVGSPDGGAAVLRGK